MTSSSANSITLPIKPFAKPLNNVKGNTPLPPKSTQQRPNTTMRYNITTKSYLSLPSISLRPQGIRQLLKNYPNLQFVDNLAAIAQHGARIGYEGPLNSRIWRPNHRSAQVHANSIRESIHSELSKGRIALLPALPDRYFCSPIGLVEKKDNGVQTGWRTIHDLSCPKGLSVNDGIPKAYGEISYETFEHAMRLVAKAGRGAHMMKRDLKSAFRHIPVNPLDYWLLIFEWEGNFYVDMFLPFGLRTAPRIFNLFSEALHWVFETLFGWDLTHYLDDFLFVFSPDIDVKKMTSEYNTVLSTFGLSAAREKDMDGQIVKHLGFEIDSGKMEVRLPQNKKLRAIQTISTLLHSKSVTFIALEEALGFLSHCCQVVPLGRPFLRNLFTLLRRTKLLSRTRISRIAKKDLQWWQLFMNSWSTISIIQLSRRNHDIATDASGLKGIGGIYNGVLFSDRVPARHRSKHINWKEMFAILHAFILWHEQWTTGRVRIACDNSVVVSAVKKRSIHGPALQPLQTILLIAALFDIELEIFWIPSEENIVADAASRHDFNKLANLGFQDQIQSLRKALPSTRISNLRKKLHSSFTNRSHHQQEAITTLQDDLMSLSVDSIVTRHSLPTSQPLHTGLPRLCTRFNQTPPKNIFDPSDPSISKTISKTLPSTTHGLSLLSEAGNGSMEKNNAELDFRLPTIYLSESSAKSTTQSMALTSTAQFAWALPDSFDLVSLRGIPGNPFHPKFILRENISVLTPMVQLL